MAKTDMFLKLVSTEGPINGESTDDVYMDQIDLISWSWGMTQSGTTHQGHGGGSGKVHVSDLSIKKYLDKATPNIIMHCCNGKHIKTANLYVRKAAGDKQIEYFKINAQEVIVTSYHTGGENDDKDRLVEHVSLNFARYTVDYTPQQDDGTPMAKVSQGWDMAKNIKFTA